VSWRYRYAWLSARRRADNAAGSVVFWSLAYTREKTARVAAEDRVHLLQVGAAEDQERLIAAGRTITELQAALELAVKGNPS
jgi:hypothetical protein